MRQFLILNSLLLIGNMLLAQDAEKIITLDTLSIDKKNIYREVGGFGLGTISFRDYATSPLVYKGLAFSLGMAKVKVDHKKETRFSTNFLFGTTLNQVEKSISDLPKEKHRSVVSSIDLRYSRLYTIHKLSKNKNLLQVGGAIDLKVISRANSSLGNNARGIDIFPTLFGSIKMSHELFVPPILKRKKTPRKQAFSIRLDMGLLNTNIRNGYAYTVHAPFYNGANQLDGYAFNWFSGIRMRYTSAYTIYTKNNNNGLKFSFILDGTLSGENPKRFAFASTMAQFTYIHSLN